MLRNSNFPPLKLTCVGVVETTFTSFVGLSPSKHFISISQSEVNKKFNICGCDLMRMRDETELKLDVSSEFLTKRLLTSILLDLISLLLIFVIAKLFAISHWDASV